MAECEVTFLQWQDLESLRHRDCRQDKVCNRHLRKGDRCEDRSPFG